LVPKINALQEALPKSIGLLSFDGGIAGNMLAGGNHGSKFYCERVVSFWLPQMWDSYPITTALSLVALFIVQSTLSTSVHCTTRGKYMFIEIPF
jgi:hypothetical protein